MMKMRIIILLLVFAGAFFIVKHNQKSEIPAYIPLDNYESDESDDSQDSEDTQEYEDTQENNPSYSSDNTESNASENDNSEDATASGLIYGLLSSKRTCGCCGDKFSPSVGYDSNGRSCYRGECTSGQTEYCSENCALNCE